MHRFAEPITQINSSLESLRDFVDVLDGLLKKKSLETARQHDELFLPLFVALSKAKNLPEPAKKLQLPTSVIARIRQKRPELDRIKVEETDDGVQLTLPIKKGFDVERAFREMSAAHKRTQTLYASALLNLTSSVELFFSRLLHEFFTLYPDAIGTKDKVFSFEDLSRFETIPNARAHYVLDKIENLLRGSLTDWLKFARETLKLSMGYLKEDLAALEESFQRRNLIVHNGGVVNSIYLSRVPEQSRGQAKLGDDLTPDREYLNNAINLWERSCILIASELWKRAAASDVERAALLGDISYKHLVAERWPVSEAISEFLLRDKEMPEPVHLNARLNLWQCRKRAGRWPSVEQDVMSFDVSTKSPRYQLPVLALQDRSDEFFEALPRALKSGALTKQELRDWPIFANMRSDVRFAKAIGKRAARKRGRTIAKKKAPRRLAGASRRLRRPRDR